MNRACYSESCDGWDLIRWRGAVKSAIRGKRGQGFLRELLDTLDQMPEKKLISDELVTPAGEVCALGSVMVKRGIDTSDIELEDADQIGSKLNIAPALVREIEFLNDSFMDYWRTTNSEEVASSRWHYMRAWVASKIQEQTNA